MKHGHIMPETLVALADTPVVLIHPLSCHFTPIRATNMVASIRKQLRDRKGQKGELS